MPWSPMGRNQLSWLYVTSAFAEPAANSAMRLSRKPALGSTTSSGMTLTALTASWNVSRQALSFSSVACCLMKVTFCGGPLRRCGACAAPGLVVPPQAASQPAPPAAARPSMCRRVGCHGCLLPMPADAPAPSPSHSVVNPVPAPHPPAIPATAFFLPWTKLAYPLTHFHGVLAKLLRARATPLTPSASSGPHLPGQAAPPPRRGEGNDGHRPWPGCPLAPCGRGDWG